MHHVLQLLDRDDRLSTYDIVSGGADYKIAQLVAPGLEDHNRIGSKDYT